MPEKRVNEGVEKAVVSKKKYEELEQKLIENLVELQRVHTALAEKFDKLSEQIASLLGLFEMAAKSFAAHPTNQIAEKDKDFLDKIDKLLDQNKTIAKGLTLIEEKVRERMYGLQGNQFSSETRQEEETQPSAINRPLPRF
ncbi:MAG: hypothetical protein AABX07_03280 [Nanoarchaeota archaeon]